MSQSGRASATKPNCWKLNVKVSKDCHGGVGETTADMMAPVLLFAVAATKKKHNPGQRYSSKQYNMINLGGSH